MRNNLRARLAIAIMAIFFLSPGAFAAGNESVAPLEQFSVFLAIVAQTCAFAYWAGRLSKKVEAIDKHDERLGAIEDAIGRHRERIAVLDNESTKIDRIISILEREDRS